MKNTSVFLALLQLTLVFSAQAETRALKVFDGTVPVCDRGHLDDFAIRLLSASETNNSIRVELQFLKCALTISDQKEPSFVVADKAVQVRHTAEENLSHGLAGVDTEFHFENNKLSAMSVTNPGLRLALMDLKSTADNSYFTEFSVGDGVSAVDVNILMDRVSSVNGQVSKIIDSVSSGSFRILIK